METEIRAAIARAFFVSAYADAYDEAPNPGFSPSGCDWMDIAPDENDPAAEKAADALAAALLKANDLSSLEALFNYAEIIHNAAEDKGDRELTPELFGHYLGMQAMGTGVGLESFGDDVHDAITVPNVEFTSCNLEREYFTA